MLSVMLLTFHILQAVSLVREARSRDTAFIAFLQASDPERDGKIRSIDSGGKKISHIRQKRICCFVNGRTHACQLIRIEKLVSSLSYEDQGGTALPASMIITNWFLRSFQIFQEESRSRSRSRSCWLHRSTVIPVYIILVQLEVNELKPSQWVQALV